MKKFFEQSENEVQSEVQNESEGEVSQKQQSIDRAKECIKKCEECIEYCEEKNHGCESCEECVEVCKLYIYSAENNSPNFKTIAQMTSDIAHDCSSVCSDAGLEICIDDCLALVEDIESLLEE